jgi:hypothetical protein
LILTLIFLQKEEIEKDCKKRQQKADTLEQLCRTLQTERTGLIQKLKAFEESNTAKPEVDTENTENTEKTPDTTQPDEVAPISAPATS